MTDLATYRPLIEKALAHTDGVWTWETLKKEVDEGRALLMVSKSGKSVVVMQPVHDIHIFTASGDLKELMLMEAEIADNARRSGYDRMTMIGRSQWELVLAKRGWVQEHSLVKAL